MIGAFCSTVGAGLQTLTGLKYLNERINFIEFYFKVHRDYYKL
jgi:hypothetical protein